MNVLSKLTKEYFGETEREEDVIKLDGVKRHKFIDISGKIHKNGYYIPDGNSITLGLLIYELIKIRGDECDLNDIDVFNITNMRGLFHYEKIGNFNGNISHWNVRRVRDMSYMFGNLKYFNQPLNDWDVSNVSDMSNMFYDAESFNQPLNKWNVEKVGNMSYMFEGAKSFNQSLGDWKPKSLVHIIDVFKGSPLENNPPKWYLEIKYKD